MAGGAFGGNRGARPVPPEKGVFPLDHMHQCDLVLSFLFGFSRMNKVMNFSLGLLSYLVLTLLLRILGEERLHWLP